MSFPRDAFPPAGLVRGTLSLLVRLALRDRTFPWLTLGPDSSVGNWGDLDEFFAKSGGYVFRSFVNPNRTEHNFAAQRRIVRFGTMSGQMKNKLTCGTHLCRFVVRCSTRHLDACGAGPITSPYQSSEFKLNMQEHKGLADRVDHCTEHLAVMLSQ